jgi:hypothetical protein
MQNLGNNIILKKYELTIQQEHDHYESYRTHVKFYVGLLGVLLGAGVIMLSRGPVQYHLVVLVGLPSLTILISFYGINSVDTGYRRWLETVTILAKLEHLLGFDKSKNAEGDSRDFKWSAEALVSTRHVVDRNSYENSEDFIKDCMRKGNHRWTVYLFRTFQIISLAIIIWCVA